MWEDNAGVVSDLLYNVLQRKPCKDLSARPSKGNRSCIEQSVRQ